MATLKARQIHRDRRCTVLVIESFVCRCESGDSMVGLLAFSEPVAIVTSNLDGSQAVDISGRPVDIEPLFRDTDGLQALLER